MIFKKIELVGFKSFADKREITFDDGVTAIVGPNGCGKSNVSDAIRWVLGEQRSKMLRGDNMQDVIFKGTAKRKSLSYCEVSIFFDNTSRIFGMDIDDIVITRKIYRSGVSEYLINNNTVRQKDIVDLLHDAGIGRDGYSIIGQGRVEQIINSKPEDRRSIFEEAAGIAKFKAKKKETENKLLNVRDNLTRQADIMREIERQIGPLKKQSEDAKRCLELKHNLRHHEINTYILQYENTAEVKEEISNVIQGVKEEIDLRQADLETQNSKYQAEMEKQTRFDDELKDLNAEVLNLSLSIQSLGSENAIVKERIGFINQDINRNKNFLQVNLEEIQELNKKIESDEQTLNEIKKQTENLNSKYAKETQKYIELTKSLSTSEENSEEANNNVINALSKLTEIKANFSAMNAEKQVLDRSNEELNAKLKELEQKCLESKKVIDEINLNNASTDVRKKDLEKKVLEYRTNSEDLELKMKLAQKESSELATNLKLKTDRLNLIKNLKADFEGYSQSVQKLLKASKTEQKIAKNIVGIIGQLISVPKEYETAIEISLGSSIHNVVTQSEQEAQELISYLKQNSFGRATFLPISSVKERFINVKDKQELLNCDGFLGIASELISYDEKVKKVINSLLNTTVVVDELKNAVKIAKQFNYSFKIVTLEGDVLSPAGSMTGGSKKSVAGNLLSRDREIETLTDEIKLIGKQKTLKESDVDNLSEDYQIQKANYEKAQRELNALNVEFASVFEKRARFTDNFNVNKASYDETYNQIQNQRQRIKEIDEELNSVFELEEKINSSIKNEQNKKQDSKELDEIRQKKEELTSSISEIRLELNSKEFEKLNCEKELSTQKQRLDFLNVENERLEEKIKDLEKNINVMLSNVSGSDASQKIKLQETQLQKAKEQIVKMEENKRILQENIVQIDTQKNYLTANLNALEKKKLKEEMQLQKVDTDLANMQDRIYEEYELTYATCQEFRVSDYNLKNGYEQIVELKKELNKLGSVNINAIEEYKAVSQRYEYLTEQTNDALKAEQELVSIINDLSKEMVLRFNNAFEIINLHFGRIFAELFGGGSAKLELVDSDDPLEAGVDIKVEPPGKKLQNMILLSGGEKALTAIAILFAILKLRPMPFCLLDEIEAALDDANVERFAKYLKRFSKETQFIVITHRKPTMELADRLFGVTMEEPGVSKIVSVNLGEAIKTAETKK